MDDIAASQDSTTERACCADDDPDSTFRFPILFSQWVSSVKRYRVIPAECRSAGLAQSFWPHLTGEVSDGEKYQKEIGPGLLFQLKPTDTGWIIRIVPKVPCSDEGGFASVVNAPHRDYNSLHVDSSYGITAKEAVENMNPREFSFVVTCEAYRIESHRLNIVLYTLSQQERDETLPKLGTSPLGKAKFTILDSKVSPAKRDIGGKNYGNIDWLRFRLDIKPPTARERKSP